MKNETFTPERIKAEADAFFEWDGEDRSLVTTTSCLLFAQHIAGLMQARAAQPAPVVPEGSIYVECRQCDKCQHVGINDAAHGLAACHDCDWSGNEPEDDKCPGCKSENCMAAACPECGARYALIASEDVAAAPAQGHQVEFGDAYQGAREDLAIWKRRALEAEEKLRQQGSIIDHLTLEAQGETRMGEPHIAQGQQVEWRTTAVMLEQANAGLAQLNGKLRAELSALKAQQVGQEPAGEVHLRKGGGISLLHVELAQPLPPGTKLYTAPQPAPATDVAGLVKRCMDEEAAHWTGDSRQAVRLALDDAYARVLIALADHDKQSGEVKP